MSESQKIEWERGFLACDRMPSCKVTPLGIRGKLNHSLERIVNQNVFPFNSPKSPKKRDRILILRLSEGSAVLEAASMDIDEKSENLSAQHLREITTPFSHDLDSGLNQFRAGGVDAHPEQRILRRKKRKISWVRVLNIAFIVFVTLTALIPAFLSSILGIAIFASSTDVPDAKIFHGDLMISQIVPAINLGGNDVLLLRNDYSWDMEIRRVISISTVGSLVKITTSDGADQNSVDSYTVKQSMKMHKVTRVVPAFGYWLTILTSVPAKILGGLVLIAINLTVQIQRSRRLRI